MRNISIYAFLVTLTWICLANLFAPIALGKNPDRTLSVQVDENNKPIFNYVIDVNGRVIDLQPYFDDEPDAENEIELDEPQPAKTKNKDCKTNQ